MPLNPGTRLGPYEIIAPLGVGGMGEVYRGRDTRLGRDVAIKALPAAFAQDPDRLARFEREAKLLASLSHTNIAGIHGLEEVAGERYLVLEIVEGETLAARVARGPIPADEACEICRQIAAGVEAAHESGVVHRDLKPGNIMLTPSGSVKVLDFGLAKGGSATETGSSDNLSASPTLTHAATGAGVVLGTAAYMSPEQARGRRVDRRTDVWSFGCVLYECLTGHQAYVGETVSDLIARILEREPDWSALPPATPPRVLELLRRCLTKDATLRLRDIGEARIALAAPNASAAAASGPVSPPSGRRWVVPVIAAALAVIATAAALLALRPSQPPGPVRRFRVPVEGFKVTAYAPLALTRDGRRIAYEANGRLWIRRLDQFEAVEVPGSKGGQGPFWSWDQQTLVFGANGKVWAFTVGSDQSLALCDVPESGAILGGGWSSDGRIVVAVWRGGLYEVPASGGDARLFLPIDSSTVDFHGPSILPDGRTLLVFVHDRGEASAVGVVRGSPPRLERVYVDQRAGCVSYSPTGHLLITRESGNYGSAVWAIPFSAQERKVTGPAFFLLDRVLFASCSSDGLLATAESELPSDGQLVWKPRNGGAEVVIGEPEPGLNSPALSPDGQRVAYAAVKDLDSDIWVQDLVRGTRVRVTSGPGLEGEPAWSRDGSRLYYSSIRNLGVGSERIVSIASDGGGVPDTVAHGIQPCPSPDGRSLVFTVDRRGNSDLWTVGLDGVSAAKPFLVTPSNENTADISPDGRWIAYASDESGREEIYIRRYPQGDQRTQVSVAGGRWPRWMPKGDAICYVKGDTLSLVSFAPGPRPVLGQPRALFAASAHEFSLKFSLMASGFERCPIDPHPDGSRFIGVRKAAAPPPRALLFVENWVEAFRKR